MARYVLDDGIIFSDRKKTSVIDEIKRDSIVIVWTMFYYI